MGKIWYSFHCLSFLFLVLFSILFYVNYKESEAKLNQLKLEQSNVLCAFGNSTMNFEKSMTGEQKASETEILQCRIRLSLVGCVSLLCFATVLVFSALCSHVFQVRKDHLERKLGPMCGKTAARIKRRRPRVSDNDREDILRANNIPVVPEPQLFRSVSSTKEVVTAELPDVLS